MLTRARPIGLPERLEHRIEEIGADTNPGVGNSNLHRVRGAAQAEEERPVLGREFHRIRQQVPHDLLQPRAVAFERNHR